MSEHIFRYNECSYREHYCATYQTDLWEETQDIRNGNIIFANNIIRIPRIQLTSAKCIDKNKRN